MQNSQITRSNRVQVLTLDQAVQGGERNLKVLIERTKPTTRTVVKEGAQQVLVAIFPWMEPTSSD